VIQTALWGQAQVICPATAPVYSAQLGSNPDLIAEAARLYVKPGMRIADVTYGRGVFWQKVDLSEMQFFASDLAMDGIDFRRLPYGDASLDVLVLDPPYMHNPGHPQVEDRYRNAETTPGLSHDDIVQLYRDGMAEARRVLVMGGLLWVKCQDEIESGRQRWAHLEVYEAGLQLGFQAVDLFVLVRSAAALQVKRQLHARKNHSYLWVFRRTA